MKRTLILALALVVAFAAAQSQFTVPGNAGNLGTFRGQVPNTGFDLSFTAMAKNDVYVDFTCGKSMRNENALEVVLGGWSNTKSVIRLGTQGRVLVEKQGPAARDTGMRTYFVKLHNGRMVVTLDAPFSITAEPWLSAEVPTLPCSSYDVAFAGWDTPVTFDNVNTYNGPWPTTAFTAPANSGHYLNFRGRVPSNKFDIAFSAMGREDIYVGIMCGVNQRTGSAIEVVLGGWGNTKSVIRRGTQFNPLVEAPGAQADPNKFKAFFVSYANNTVSVWAGNKKEKLVMKANTPPLPCSTAIVAHTAWDAPVVYDHFQRAAKDDYKAPVVPTPAVQPAANNDGFWYRGVLQGRTVGLSTKLVNSGRDYDTQPAGHAITGAMVVVDEENPVAGCNEENVSYQPISNFGPASARSVESTPALCQARCARTPNCAYFSWWRDGGCHLINGNGRRTQTRGVVAGPAVCTKKEGVPMQIVKNSQGDYWCTKDGRSWDRCQKYKGVFDSRFACTNKFACDAKLQLDGISLARAEVAKAATAAAKVNDMVRIQTAQAVAKGTVAVQSALREAQAVVRAKEEAVQIKQNTQAIAQLERVGFAAERTAKLQGQYLDAVKAVASAEQAAAKTRAAATAAKERAEEQDTTEAHQAARRALERAARAQEGVTITLKNVEATKNKLAAAKATHAKAVAARTVMVKAQAAEQKANAIKRAAQLAAAKAKAEQESKVAIAKKEALCKAAQKFAQETVLAQEEALKKLEAVAAKEAAAEKAKDAVAAAKAAVEEADNDKEAQAAQKALERAQDTLKDASAAARKAQTEAEQASSNAKAAVEREKQQKNERKLAEQRERARAQARVQDARAKALAAQREAAAKALQEARQKAVKELEAAAAKERARKAAEEARENARKLKELQEREADERKIAAAKKAKEEADLKAKRAKEEADKQAKAEAAKKAKEAAEKLKAKLAEEQERLAREKAQRELQLARERDAKAREDRFRQQQQRPSAAINNKQREEHLARERALAEKLKAEKAAADLAAAKQRERDAETERERVRAQLAMEKAAKEQEEAQRRAKEAEEKAKQAKAEAERLRLKKIEQEMAHNKKVAAEAKKAAERARIENEERIAQEKARQAAIATKVADEDAKRKEAERKAAQERERIAKQKAEAARAAAIKAELEERSKEVQRKLDRARQEAAAKAKQAVLDTIRKSRVADLAKKAAEFLRKQAELAETKRRAAAEKAKADKVKELLEYQERLTTCSVSKAPTQAPLRSVRSARPGVKAPVRPAVIAPVRPAVKVGAPTNASIKVGKVPTNAPTKAVIKAPTKVATKASTKVGKGPTMAPTKAVIKAPTNGTKASIKVGKLPTMAPTKAVIKAPTNGTKASTKAPTKAVIKAGAAPGTFVVQQNIAAVIKPTAAPSRVTGDVSPLLTLGNDYVFESVSVYALGRVTAQEHREAFVHFNGGSWLKIVPALNGQQGAVSLETMEPGVYLRHRKSDGSDGSQWYLQVERSDGSQLYKNDASFVPRPGNAVPGVGERVGYVSFESTNNPGYFIRVAELTDSPLILQKREQTIIGGICGHDCLTFDKGTSFKPLHER